MNRLTLLQRGVLKRLGDRGYNAIAVAAREAWVEGGSLDLSLMAGIITDPELAEDFERANQQRPEGT